MAQAEAPPFPRTGPYAPADRRLAVRVLFGVGLLALAAIAGPLFSYRSDVEELHRVLHARLVREARVYSGALTSHLRMLESELLRLAARPEMNLLDNSLAPEQELLSFTHHNSALFTTVALLDVSGHALWSEPRDALPPTTAVAGRPWFQRLLALQKPVVGSFEPGGRRLVVAVPVLRGRRTTGVLVGLLDPRSQDLPGSRPESESLDLLVMDREGSLFLPPEPPPWALQGDFRGTVNALFASRTGERLVLSGREHYATALRLGDTGLSLMLAVDEASFIAPVRQRFLIQLFFIAVLQALTVLLFTLYLRSTYRTFLQMESRAAQQEKLAALGQAASLIAHEVKNSLNGLKAAATLMESGAEPALPVRSMRGQIDRLAHLASSLLHFGKPAVAQRVPTDLNQLVRDAVEGLKALPEADEVEVRTAFAGPLTASCDPLLLTTALDNLLRNAVEAGAVARDLGKVELPRVSVTVTEERGEALIRVEDNAGGPPAGFEARLFQPFVTGKPKGIGLGLSMARQALEQQGGKLEFERTPEGSRFTVQLAVVGA